MTGTMSARTPSIKPATANLPLVAVPARALDQPMALNVTAAIPMVGYTIGIQNNSAAATPSEQVDDAVCGGGRPSLAASMRWGRSTRRQP